MDVRFVVGIESRSLQRWPEDQAVIAGGEGRGVTGGDGRIGDDVQDDEGVRIVGEVGEFDGSDGVLGGDDAIGFRDENVSEDDGVAIVGEVEESDDIERGPGGGDGTGL